MSRSNKIKITLSVGMSPVLILLLMATQAVLIGLRIERAITWDWLWVLAPTWGPWALAVCLLLIPLASAVIDDWRRLGKIRR